MMDEILLKEKLTVLAQNEFQPLEQEDISELVPEMLSQIGSVDSHLRDDLIYTGFYHWIVTYQAISQDQLRELFSEVLSERYLFHQIGETGTDSVFRRSFSVLLLALLLYAHRSSPYLTGAEIIQAKENLLRYLAEEQDRRGYASEKGWAHAIAHTADALDELAQCAELEKTDLSEILGAIRETICWQEIVYGHGEDERLVTAALAVINRKLAAGSEISAWIDAFGDAVLSANSPPGRIILRSNIKNFLQSLSFRLGWEGMPDEFQGPIDQTLRRISPYVKGENG